MLPKISNAAGTVKSLEQVERLAQVPLLDRIVIGSITYEPREGNTGGTNFYISSEGTSVNSLGLPNAGMADLLKWLPMAWKAAGGVDDKDLVLSLAGFNADDFVRLMRACWSDSAIYIELNFGCPNVLEDGHPREIISYSPALVDSILTRLQSMLTSRVRVKLSPYVDPKQREEIVHVLNQYRIGGVVCTNTIPGVRLRNSHEQPALAVAKGLGGMAGVALHHLAVANAEHFRELLRKDISVIGVGGIHNAQTMRDFVLVGVDEIQIGTAYLEQERPRIFEHIVRQYVQMYEGT